MDKIYAFITVFIWSTVYIPTRYLLENFSPMQIGEMRYFVAAIVLLTVAVIRHEKIPNRKDWILFFAGGFFGFAFYIFAFNTAADLLPSGVCSFVVTTSTIFTALLAAVFLKEKLLRGEIFSLLIQLAGVGVLTLTGGTMSFNSGIILMLLAALSLGIYNLIQRKLVKKGYSAMQITTYCIACGCICMVPASGISFTEIPRFGIKELEAVCYLGMLASAVAYYLWARAMSISERTGSVANFMFLIPFLTSVIGRIVLKEVPGMQVYIGGALLSVGFLIYMYCGKIKSKKEG